MLYSVVKSIERNIFLSDKKFFFYISVLRILEELIIYKMMKKTIVLFCNEQFSELHHVHSSIYLSTFLQCSISY